MGHSPRGRLRPRHPGRRPHGRQSGISISANSFNGMIIYSTDNSKRGQVIKVYDADAGTGDPITLMVKQLYLLLHLQHWLLVICW